MPRVIREDDPNTEVDETEYADDEIDNSLPGEGEEAPAEEGPRPWEFYANDAIRQLYPHMRDGVDYTWSRPADDPNGTPQMLYWDEKYAAADMGEVQRIAELLRDADPYGGSYTPQQSLHSPVVKDAGSGPGPDDSQQPL